MPRFVTRFCLLVAPLLLPGCASRPPSSAFDGRYSAVTGQPLLPGTGAGSYKGYDDFRALQFHPDRCPTAPVQPPRKVLARAGLPIMPGIVMLTDTLGIDEAEIANQEWLQYQRHQQRVGVPEAELRPLPAAQPVPAYYTDPFYRYYPVVGISHAQAEAFCRWRSRVVTRLLNEGRHTPDSLSADYLRCTYRLPTEAEWELAAAAGGTAPQGIDCLQLPLRVDPQAAAYLQRRSGTSTGVAQIEADIRAYNRSQPRYSWINYAQTEPYFLRLITPGYVYQGPPNDFAVYQILGNAAELVQEPGLTKGRSYRDPLAACTVKARGSYTGPAPTLGFRCVCSVSYPNRK